MQKCATVGSSFIDVIAILADADIERVTMHNATSSYLLLEQGRKVDALDINSYVGGGALNSAAALNLLGYEVAPVIRIGDDQHGVRIRSWAAQHQIDDRFFVVDEDESTGFAVMVSSHTRDATIFTHRGANTTFTPPQFPTESFDGAQLVYIASLSGNSAACYPDIVSAAAATPAFIATNPGERQIRQYGPEIAATFPDIDLLVVNRNEFEQLLSALSINPVNIAKGWRPNHPRLFYQGVKINNEPSDFRMAIIKLLSQGLRNIAVTDGADGAYFADDRGIIYIPSLKAPVRGTAGAGDAFACTLAAWLAEGQPSHVSLLAATANASSVVAHADTQTGLLSRRAMKKSIASIVDTTRLQSFEL